MNQKTRLVKRRNSASSRAFLGSSQKVGGANKGLGEATKSCTRKEHESATNSIARRGQGENFPLQGQGGTSSLLVCPLWGLGQRLNCSASNLLKGRSQQGAGSEASLPVTLRVRRRAPKLLSKQLAHCRARWARLTSIGRSRFLSLLVFFVT